MSKYFALLITIGIAIGGCSSHAKFPWSLEGKTVPKYNIVSNEEISATEPITFALSVVVSPDISKEDLTTVSQKIIEELPRHNLVTIFYYSDPKQVHDAFTVGKAWWGVDDDKNFPPPGDYSHHVLKVERK